MKGQIEGEQEGTLGTTNWVRFQRLGHNSGHWGMILVAKVAALVTATVWPARALTTRGRSRECPRSQRLAVCPVNWWLLNGVGQVVKQQLGRRE